MTALAVALGLALAGSVGVIVWLVRAYVAESREARAAADMLHAERDVARERESRLIEERDQFKIRLDVSTQVAAALKTRLAIAETQRNRAYLEERERVVETIRSAGVADASALVNRILQGGPLSQAGPAAAGNGDRRADPVRSSAAAPATVQARRIPKP